VDRNASNVFGLFGSAKMKLRSTYATACLLALGCPAQAADFKCPEPTMQVAQNIVADTQSKTISIVNAGDPELKSTVQNTIINLWAAYPQADRIAVGQNLLSTSCNLIKSSNLADERKLDRWTKLIELLLQSVPLEQRSYLELPPNFLSTIRLKDTGMEFAKSILGVPRLDVDGIAKFEKSGYLIKIAYLTADKENLASKGMIYAISIQLDQRSGKPPGTVIFDGKWNRFYGFSGNPPLINPNAVLGSSTLKEFRGKGSCGSVAGMDVPLDDSRHFFCITGNGGNNPTIRFDVANKNPEPAQEISESLKKHDAKYMAIVHSNLDGNPDLEAKFWAEDNRLKRELLNELDNRVVLRFEIVAETSFPGMGRNFDEFPVEGERAK
jgi:hypothetical protein